MSQSSPELTTIELTEFAFRVGRAESRGRGFHFHSLQEVPLVEEEKVMDLFASLENLSGRVIAAVQPTSKYLEVVNVEELSSMSAEKDLQDFIARHFPEGKKTPYLAAVDAERGKPYLLEGIKELNAFVACFPETNINNALGFLKDCEIQPDMMQPSTLLHLGSLLHMLNFSGQSSPVMMLEIGEKHTQVCFLSTYGITSIHTLDTGTADIIETLSEELNLSDPEQAAKIFFGGMEDLSEIEQPLLKPFLEKLNPLLEDFEAKTNQLPTHQFSIGVPSFQKWLGDALGRHLNIPSVPVDFPSWLETLEITCEEEDRPILHSFSSMALVHLLRAGRANKPEFPWQFDFLRAKKNEAVSPVEGTNEPPQDDTTASDEESEEPLMGDDFGEWGQEEEEESPSAPPGKEEKDAPGLRLKSSGKKPGKPKKPSGGSLRIKPKEGKSAPEKPPPSSKKTVKDEAPSKPKISLTPSDEEKKQPAPPPEDAPVAKKAPESPKAKPVGETKSKDSGKKAEKPESQEPETPTQSTPQKKDSAKPKSKGKKPLLVALFLLLLAGGGILFFLLQNPHAHIDDLPPLGSASGWQRHALDSSARPSLAMVHGQDHALTLTAYPETRGSPLNTAVFTGQRLNGRQSILLRLDEVTGNAQAGVMIRRSEDPNSPAAFFFRDGGDLVLLYREAPGGPIVTENANAPGGTSLWLRLDHSNDRLQAFYSTDREEWETLPRINLEGEDFLLGMALNGDPEERESIARFYEIRSGTF